MINKAEQLNSRPEAEDGRIIRLEGYVISETRTEKDITTPYIRIFDQRSRESIIAPWPLDLRKMPDRVEIACDKSKRIFSVSMAEILESYASEETYRTETELSLLMVIPEESQKELAHHLGLLFLRDLIEPGNTFGNSPTLAE